MLPAAPAARRGRPPLLDRESILDAAGAMAPDELSMASLGRALGVTPAALYHYFRDRDAVHEAVAARLLDEVVLPAPVLGWDEWLRSYAELMRTTVRESPWARHLVARTTPLDAGLRHVRAALDVLGRDGFAPTDALLAVQLVQRFAVMTGVLEAISPLLPRPGAAFATQLDCLVAGIEARLQECDR